MATYGYRLSDNDYGALIALKVNSSSDFISIFLSNAVSPPLTFFLIEWHQMIGIIHIHVMKIPKNWKISGQCPTVFG